MRTILQDMAKSVLRSVSWNWKPYSRLILYGDNVGWSLDWDMRELANISRRLGIRKAHPIWKHAAAPQSIFFASQFFFSNSAWLNLLPHRIGFSYFHGMPNTGEDNFDQIYEALKKHHKQITRIQVSHVEMRDVALQTGVDPSKVFLIPIGINTDFFPFRTIEQKRMAREELGISQSAFVIGSFQKDGVGWGDGMEPKLIKGPDVLVSTLKLLKKDIPDLYVLLSGPARGYVKKGLEEAGIPYKHVYLQSYPKVAKLFQALDLYLVSSRQEGGPKAILESMSSGVPLVTTRVGQAMDMVKHGENAFMAEVEDVEALASYVLHVYNSSKTDLISMLQAGRRMAESNSYESQTELWKSFMSGYVDSEG